MSIDNRLKKAEDTVKVDLQATRVFFENMMSDKEININIGGGGSSKSFSIRQLLTYKLLTEKKKKILVVRKTMPSLRTSVLMPFYETLDSFNVRHRIKEDKVGFNMFFGDSFIHFNGLDSVEKIKSASWNYLWVEEATDITKEDFNTLRLYLRERSFDGKPNQVFLSFNPIDEFHWIKEYLIDNPEFKNQVKVVHSTYQDNPFLDDRSKQRYEELINQDVNFYRIYALGEWGKLENLIYRNWDIVDTIPNDGKQLTLYGIDFGFNDPTVIVKCLIKDKEVWLEELLYKSNMTNSQLIDFMQKELPKSEWSKPIYSDSAEPQRIKEIRLAGFNIKPAQKNILDGIDMVKRLKLHVLKGSNNIVKELRAYSWKTNKQGHIIDEPVPFLDHAMDATRYPIYSHLRGEGIYRVRWL